MYTGETITREELCRTFDHSNLKAYADEAAFRKLCDEAKENHCAMVAINSGPTALCHKLLEGTDIHVGAAISFPLGQTTIEEKVHETQEAIKNGADEIDYVLNVGEVKNGNYNYIRKEMEAIVGVCRNEHVISKVIFEICYLTEEEIIQIAKIAKEDKAGFCKNKHGIWSGRSNCRSGKINETNRW